MSIQTSALASLAMLVALSLPSQGYGQGMPATPESRGVYRLPFADGTVVEVFDDFATHRPRGRVDIYAIHGTKPYRVVAAAAGRVVAIQDGYSEQQSGRAAALCHNNYVWIAHPNGEWTNYSHLAHGSATDKAHLKVGEQVAAGQYIGDEGAVGCAMLKHVHFEVAVPDPAHPIDSGGFLIDNENGKRELNPRFCGVPGWNAIKGRIYVAASCLTGKESESRVRLTHDLVGGMVNARSRGTIMRRETAMADNRERQHHEVPKSVSGERNMPATDGNTGVPEPPSETSPRWKEPQGIQKGIADADRTVRTGSKEETVRNTPPAGAWNETSAD